MIKRVFLHDNEIDYEVGKGTFAGIVTKIQTEANPSAPYVFIVYINDKPRIFIPYHAVSGWLEE